MKMLSRFTLWVLSAALFLPSVVHAAAQLALQNNVSPSVYSPGNATAVSYTLTIFNNGTEDPAAGLSDSAPAGVNFTGWSALSGTCSPASGGAGAVSTSCKVPAGGSVSVIVNGQISASASGNIINTATVVPSAGNVCAGSGSCTAQATVAASAAAAKLSVQKTASISTYPSGTATSVTYTIVVSNSATVASQATKLSENPDPYLSFQSLNCSNGATGPFPLSLNVPAQGSVTCTIQGTISSTATTTVRNAVTVTPAFQDQCASPGSCSSFADVAATTPPVKAQLALRKTASLSTYTTGTSTPLTYTLTVTNSTSAAGTTGLNDPVPQGITFDSWSCPGANGAGQLQATLNVPANASLSCTVNATIAASSAGTVTNTASLTPGASTICTVCSSAASVVGQAPPPAGADLTLSKTVSDATYQLGTAKDISYRITVKNTSSQAASTFTLSDVAPSGVSLGAWSAPGCTPGSGSGNVSIQCALAANASLTLAIPATIAANASGTITNIASLSVTGQDTCGGRSSCDAQASTQPQTTTQPGPSTTTLQSSLNPSTVGGNVTFTATVTGNSPTGAVTFLADGQTICSNVSLSAAICSTSVLSAGQHTIRASYSGDSRNQASTANIVQTVTDAGPSTSTTALTTGWSPSIAGHAVELKVVVAGSSPSGSVQFKDGNDSLCTVPLRVVRAESVAYCVAVFSSEGTHSLTANYAGDSRNSPSAGSFDQVVTAAGAMSINQFGLTGAWYNPATSGQGMLINTLPAVTPAVGTLFVGWFTYDLSGNPRWYAMQGALDGSDLVIYQGLGGNFNAPPKIGATAIGHASVNFGDCSHATVRYTFDDGSGRTGTIPITRLSPPTTCSPTGDITDPGQDNGLSGSWYNPPTSGQGVLLDVNAERTLLFGAWYTYAPGGELQSGAASQRWFTLQTNNFAPGSREIDNVPIFTGTGGVFDDPTPTTTTQVGVANIRFTDCNTMKIDYTFTVGELAGISNSLTQVRLGGTPKGCQ